MVIIMKTRTLDTYDINVFSALKGQKLKALLTYMWVKSDMKVSDFILLMRVYEHSLVCLEVVLSDLNIQA